MQAYLYDNENYYLGITILQESPLEPGVYFDKYNCTKIAPPEYKETEIPYWNGDTWELKPNYSKVTFYNKKTKEEKKYEIGQDPDLDTYTDIVPLENEAFQKFENDKWVIDEEAKKENELKIRQNKIQTLLLATDYIELPSYLERKGQSALDAMMKYRSELRSAYRDSSLPIPEVPNV